MKTLVLALIFALMLMSGSALQCNNCVPIKGSRCTNTIETCGYKKDACISARFTFPPYSYFRRCIAMSDCLLLQSTPSIVAQCCQTNLCN